MTRQKTHSKTRPCELVCSTAIVQCYLDIAGVMMVALDVEGRIILLNKRGCEILQCTESEAMGVDWFDTFILPRDRKEIREVFNRLIRDDGEFPEYYENAVLTKTGRERLIAWHNTLLRDAAGSVVAALSSGSDITEQKQAEQALRFTQFATDHATEAAFWVNSDGRFVYVNEAACRNMGYSRQELLQMGVFDINPVFPSSQWPQLWRQLQQQGIVRFESCHKAKDGRVFPVAIAANYLVYEGRQYSCAIVRDISERKAAEQTQQRLMRQLQSKNEELQSIMFIASHDLRSPLVNICGFTGELEKSFAQLQVLLAAENLSESAQKQLDVLLKIDIPESLGLINAGSRKMDALLAGLLRLNRIGTAQLCPITLDMNQMFKGIVENSRFRMRRTDIEILVDESIPACRGDAVLINQVFTNLIENAIKYRHPGRPARIHISARTEDGMVIYCVADNGIGIAPEYLDKVFEIFYRLNPGSEQAGEGLGLTIVRRILDRQDGRIWIESTPGAGTSVYVQLPKA